jgi:hypothetical protein
MVVDRFGIVATGFVQMIQHALISPEASRSNMSTAPGPNSVLIVSGGKPHCSSTNARSSAEVTARCPGRPGPM